VGFVDRWIARVLAAGATLVLPVSLLLFLQWPLREWVHAGSREANDLAQILFALFVALAVTAATRDRTHLAADLFARRYPPAWRGRIARFACLAILAPAAAFVLWSGGHGAWNSLLQLERFPETLNPGYFLLRFAALALAALVLLQALVDAFASKR
jgi:TRAP-type C4-dicarboxylate transport system permease small subunit